jgi:ABC-2 type transport system permease protein
MLAIMGENLENLKYATIFTLFPGEKIISGASGVFSSNLILALIGVILYIGGTVCFVKKDLPL